MKEAVVFVLDGYASMNTPVQGTQQSRFELSKQIIVSMISDLMLQSTTNEVSVIITKTNETLHHQMAATEDSSDLEFRNLTELTPGIVRPTVDLLRRIQQLQVNLDSSNNRSMQGDLCDGMLMAADAHYERGTRYKFQRKIVVFTDAAHALYFNVPQMCTMVDALRDMQCTLEIVGLDFVHAGTYDHPLGAEHAVKAVESSNLETSNSIESNNKRIKLEEPDQQDAPPLQPVSHMLSPVVQHEYENEPSNNDAIDDEDINIYTDQHQREQVLLKLTQQTGGSVQSIQNTQQMLQIHKGRRIPKSTKFQCELKVAPNLVFPCRHFLILKKLDIPTMKKEAVLVDDKDGAPLLDEHGNERTDAFARKILYVDPDHPDEIVDEFTNAVLFGSSLVPMSEFDYEGLKHGSGSGVRVEILGYLERAKVPLSYITGPPSGLTGSDKVVSCAGIAALSRALTQEDKVGIGTFYKSNRSSEPLLVAIYPFEDRLLTLQIPYEGEVRNLSLQPLPETVPDKSQVCDNLIDSLMLDDDVLESGTVPSPFYRSWHQTKLRRALHPGSREVVETRDESLMSTPKHVLKGAEEPLRVFQTTFPLETAQEKKGVTKKAGKKTLTYTNFA